MRDRRPRHASGRSRLLGRAAVLTLLVALVNGCGSTASTPGPDPIPGPSDPPATATPAASPGPTERLGPSPDPDPATWPLAWSDDFDGPAGTPPDPETWGFELGDGSTYGLVGWGNNERQFYTDDPANASLDGEGNLVITLRRDEGARSCWYGPCEFTSARLTTRDRRTVEYGRVEARMRVPEGFGVWPAFWMLGTDVATVPWPACGEIDVMEYVGRRPTEVLGTIHGPGYSGSGGFTKTVDLGEPVSAAFHTFAVEWVPGRIRWLLDGTVYHEATPADVAPDAWAFDHPFYLILNLAVGGNLGGLVDPALPVPLELAVDYVRVYGGAGT